MHITLKPGEHIAVQFHETDGEFEIHFDTPKHPRALVVEETSQALMNAVGVIFRENFNFVEGDEISDDAAEIDNDDRRLSESHDDITLAAVQKIPAPAAAWSSGAQRVGFFMDAHNQIHCTSMVLCRVIDDSWVSKKVGPKWKVETLSADNDVTGEYDFYATLEELESVSGTKLARKVVV